MWCSHCGTDRKTVREPDQEYMQEFSFFSLSSYFQRSFLSYIRMHVTINCILLWISGFFYISGAFISCCPCCGKVLEYPVYKSRRMIVKTKKNQGLRGRAVNLESLFYMDDLEVDQYLHNEEEKRLKKIIWEEMNREYLEEQAVKKSVAAAAAERACQARLPNGSEKLLSAQELTALTSAALAKSRKEKRHNHAANKKNSTSTKSHRGACNELKRKSFSSKINYKVLESLYKDNEKKQRTESKTGEKQKETVTDDGCEDGDGDYFGRGDEEYGSDEWDSLN